LTEKVYFDIPIQ